MPSLREKKRYLAFEILGKSQKSLNFKFEDVKLEIVNMFLSLFGVIELGNAGLIFLKNKWDDKMNKGIIRINNKYVNALKASLTMITKINNEQIIIRSIGTSGTLKNAHEKYIVA